MNALEIKELAQKFYDSERTRTPIAPPTSMYPDITVDEAYAVQMENIQRVTAEGQVISGKKIGLTSPGIQKQLGVFEPDYGHLFQSMDCSSDGKLDSSALISPRIEGEVAFILKADLTGGNVTEEDVRAATDYVVAAFEIVDSRVENWTLNKVTDTISDNASTGRYILGTKRMRLQDINLPEEKLELYKNGELVGTGSGAAVLGDPVKSVVWLSNRLWSYGIVLKKGEVILSGAFSAAPPATRGDKVEARFSTFGTVTAEFV